MLRADPPTTAGWVAESFRALRWKQRPSDAAQREGAALWVVGGPVREFFLDDLDVVRWITPRAAAYLAHGQAVTTIASVPGDDTRAAPRTAVTLSLVHGLFSCRESLGAVARGLRARAVHARALHPDDVPTWVDASEIEPGSPAHPASGRRLFRRA
jgi:hypothetical protein